MKKSIMKYSFKFLQISLGLALANPSALHAEAMPGKTPASYAQLLADQVAYENADVRSVGIYARRADTDALALIGRIGAPPANPDAAIAATDKLAKTSETGDAATGVTTRLPLLDDKGGQIGVLVLGFAPGTPARGTTRMAQSVVIRDFLQWITPKRDTLFDPYMKGYDGSDTLAQRVNQILLARHPDVNVVALHLTKPGDKTNKVWGINRPNFIGRDSDEIDTDTEKTARIVMQVIPATHRMEVHMPLRARDGRLFGTLCTVYFWRTEREAADYYGRSLSMMEEARLLMPDNRDDLFRP